MKNMASSDGDEVFEKFSEQARQTFLIFPTVSVSEKKKEHRQNMYGKYYNRIPPQLIRGSHPSQHPVSRNHSAQGNTNQINKNKIW